jgi:hypothetical protein
MGSVLTFIKKCKSKSVKCDKCNITHKYSFFSPSKKCICCYNKNECKLYCKSCRHYHDPTTGECGYSKGSIVAETPNYFPITEIRENKKSTSRKVISHYTNETKIVKTPIYKTNFVDKRNPISRKIEKFRTENIYGYVGYGASQRYQLIGTKTIPYYEYVNDYEHKTESVQEIVGYNEEEVVERIPVYENIIENFTEKKKIVIDLKLIDDKQVLKWVKLSKQCKCRKTKNVNDSCQQKNNTQYYLRQELK